MEMARTLAEGMRYSKPVVNVVWNEFGCSDVFGIHFVSR